MNDSTKKQIFFIFLILFTLLAIYFVVDLIFSLSGVTKLIFLIVFIIVLLIGVFLKFGFVLFLKEYERSVIMRFGKLNRVAGPGWAFYIPGLETHKKVDLRVQTIDIPSQTVVTKDNVAIKVDAVIYLFVKKDPVSVINSVVNVKDYMEASQLYIKSSIRKVIGNMTLSEAISNISELNKRLLVDLAKISKDWGVSIESVELKNIVIPDTVVEAMHKEKASEQEKLAIVQLAEAEKQKIATINTAASDLSEKSITYYYIKALEEISKGASTKIIFPMEFSRLAEVLAGKVAPKSGEKNKLEGFLKKYGDVIEANVEKLEKKTKNSKQKK